MKALNKKYKDTTWTTGLFPTPIAFNNMTEEHIPFLERIGLSHLIIEVCDACKFEKCKCNKKVKKTKEDEAEQE